MGDPISDLEKVQEANVTDSALACQTCDEIVSEGYYNATEATLTWKCSEGHKSIIKEVSF